MKKEENIEKMLNNMLESSTTDSAFSTPVNYFSVLPSDITNSIQKISSLSLENPTIEEFPFEIPDHYFENLSSQVSNRIKSKNETKNSIFVLLKHTVFTPSLLSAAMVIIGFFYFQRPQQIIINHPVYSVQEFGDSKYLDALNENDLIDFLSDQGLEKENNELEQYLLDNNVDASQLEIIL